jgi:hypothetical protein
MGIGFHLVCCDIEKAVGCVFLLPTACLLSACSISFEMFFEKGHGMALGECNLGCTLYMIALFVEKLRCDISHTISVL